MTLNLKRIDGSRLDLRSGVIKAQALATAGEASDLVAQAHDEADRLLAAARESAREELAQRERELQVEVWRAASGYAEALQAEWDRALGDLESRIADLLGRALRRMCEQVPADERLRACVQQLIEEAGTPDGGTLLVSPQAHAAVRSIADDLPWPIQQSDDLAPGTVRLVASHGRWECGIDTMIENLVDALGTPEDREGEHHV